MLTPSAKTTLSIFKTLFCASVLFLCSSTALAETMSSTNYRIQADSLSIGGNRSTSAGYIADDTLGEIATGEGMSSTNYGACSGYQCFETENYISFTVKEGLTSPGTAGAGVTFGLLTTSNVTTSNGTSINSVFITAEGNSTAGVVVSVISPNEGLQRVSAPGARIPSATGTLSAGTEGYGICVFSNTENGDSPTSFVKNAPYDGNCLKADPGHAVGIVDGTSRAVLSSTGQLKGGSAEILVKAAISVITDAGADYSDALTFIATGTY